jgi:hypothetical protein
VDVSKVLLWRVYEEVVVCVCVCVCVCVFRNKLNAHALWELSEEDSAGSTWGGVTLTFDL